ncbi:MAG TPA: CBS domain-containing protein [Candidatus Acidoferrum sp.]|nr:CBS domain-containing protein [Candidatus Acidoferrum sp.]
MPRADLNLAKNDQRSNANLVQEYMTRKIITCRTSSTLLDVEELLSNQRVSRVVVVDAKRSPKGIISEKDVMRFMLTDNSTRGLNQTCAHEIMSSRLIAIQPHVLVSRAAEMMIRENISSLLVEDEHLEGILTKADIANYLGATKHRTDTVDHFMTSSPVIVEPSQSLLSVVGSMSQNKISRVVVIDQNHEPKGIITLADLTLLLLSFCFGRTPANDFLKRTETIGLTAKDFMTHNPLTIDQSLDLSEAARMITKHRVSGLPVTNNSKKLTGIVSKTDITRAVAYEGKVNHPIQERSYREREGRTPSELQREETCLTH